MQLKPKPDGHLTPDTPVMESPSTLRASLKCLATCLYDAAFAIQRKNSRDSR